MSREIPKEMKIVSRLYFASGVFWALFSLVGMVLIISEREGLGKFFGIVIIILGISVSVLDFMNSANSPKEFGKRKRKMIILSALTSTLVFLLSFSTSYNPFYLLYNTNRFFSNLIFYGITDLIWLLLPISIMGIFFINVIILYYLIFNKKLKEHLE